MFILAHIYAFVNRGHKYAILSLYYQVSIIIIMITKEQYIESLSKEFAIIKHLGEKVKPEQLSHKPTEKQRTTQELMHYLTYIFAAGTESIVTSDTDAWKKYTEAPVPTHENFVSLMNDEESKVLEFLSGVTEENLAEELHMWGRTQSKALHLLGLHNIAVAYKMQLFLYLKQSGTENIGTMNLWAGMDQPPAVK